MTEENICHCEAVLQAEAIQSQRFACFCYWISTRHAEVVVPYDH